MNNYFSHDSNARNADNIIPLRMKMGVEGYGIYFMILERLRDEPDYTSIKDYNMLAFDFRVSADKVKLVVEDFGLFSFTEDGKRFYSESFLRRMQQKDDKSEKARTSANARWKKCERNANASENDAIKGKESKEEYKERKENTSYSQKERKKDPTPEIATPVSSEEKEPPQPTPEPPPLHPLQVFIRDKLPNVAKLKYQLTGEEAEKLSQEFDKVLIRDTLQTMDNWKPLLQKNLSVNLTLRPLS